VDTYGMSFLLKHIGFQRTATHSPMQLVRDLEALGAVYSTSVGREHLRYCTDVESDKLEAVVPILAGVLKPCWIEEFELDHTVRRVKRDVSQTLSNPAVTVFEQLHAEAFRNNGLGLPLYPRSLHLDYNQLDAFRAQNSWNAERVVIVAVGNVHHERFLQVVSEEFHDCPNISNPAKIPAKYIGADYLKIPQPLILPLAFKGHHGSTKIL